MAGQEGFEPTTRGFGIRCSTVGATALFAFAMNGVLTTELAELFQLDLIGCFLLVLVRRVILTLTRRTIQTNRDSHTSSPRPVKAGLTETKSGSVPDSGTD